MRPRHVFALGLIGAVLGGCTSLPADHGRAGLEAVLATRGVQLPGAAGDGLAPQFVGRPLGGADVLAIALANNPALGEGLAQLSISAADLYQAGRPANPRLSASLLVPDVGGEADKISFGLAQDFANLLLLPARSRIADGEFERERERIGATVLALAAEVDAATIRLAGAMQMLRVQEAIAEAASLASELAERFHAAGNIDRLTLALEQGAAIEARLATLRARAEHDDARTDLNRLMGLPADEQRWQLDGRLALPPAQDTALDELQELARRERLDLAAARREVGLRADAAGLVRRARLLGELSLGAETEREPDRTRLTGPTLDLELPLFDQGRGRLTRAEAEYRLAQTGLRALELDIGAAIRRAHTALIEARARATLYREQLIPLRAQIVEEGQRQLDYMLRGPFEQLLARQQEYAAQAGYVEAVRDYWLARSDLGREVGTLLPARAQAPLEWLELSLPGEPAPASADPHAGHDMGKRTPDPHAGHDMGKQTPDPHAGHDMGKQTPDPHAGHDMGKQTPDPHAGHDMGEQVPAAQPAPDPHAGHHEHGQGDSQR